jgi:glycerol-3-phosphate dehydrogenase
VPAKGEVELAIANCVQALRRVHQDEARAGGRVERVLGSARALSDLGDEIAPGLYESELRYLQREEWARSADDVLWRRSKLGLHFNNDERERVARWAGWTEKDLDRNPSLAGGSCN